MDLISILLIAFGLSMDSFAVSISQGICTKKLLTSQALKLALIFGLFQGAMPAIGYFVGQFFADTIKQIDHWLAFFILTIIGIKMIIESLKEDNCECEDKCVKDNFQLKFLATLAIATSIDALAAGFIFTPFPDKILLAVVFIGLVTFVMSFLGVKLGFMFGSKLKFNFEIVGGVVLILIGTKILIEHTILA